MSRIVSKVVLSLCAASFAGCATTASKIAAETAVVRANLKKALANNAPKPGCAPKEYALAEANLEFAITESDRGNSFRAKQHMDLAVEKSAAAVRISEATPGCKPVQVLVRAPPPPPKPVVVKLTPTDKDGDGVMDNVDRCIDQPEDPDGWLDEDGCPDPDNDGDNVLDESDRCRNEPGPVENGGCPDVDSDADTLVDRLDPCPREPGPVENKGCPDMDSDSDTVVDRLDSCPREPGPVDNKGCPKIWVDSDSDGIGDEIDNCPTQPEDKDRWNDEDGCPDPDNDMDGLVDTKDDCPNEAGPLEARGCPDADSDLIPDRKDQCPGEPEDADGFEDSNGCPDLDNDRDGVPDSKDKCVNQAGVIENEGCPDLDGDGDRIPDRVDKCPAEFGIPEEQGCPKKYTLVVVKRDAIEIKQQVHFATNKATILPDSFELLNQVAQVFRDYPTMRVRVEGHTDNVGDDAKNLRLSQARADAVAAYLKAQGIDPSRLDAVGFGETRPIASNATAKGRAANRRVEFKIIER